LLLLLLLYYFIPKKRHDFIGTATMHIVDNLAYPRKLPDCYYVCSKQSIADIV